MNKKLMAVAVAGALAVPALAFAQASTVQIYGKITYEYSRIDQGAGLLNTDVTDVPGGTAIGFKGEEKLGGGLSAWFQCETSADVRGMDKVGLCGRNSAIGFKGGFGNLHFGKWDTPMKRALNMGSVGAQETGSLGTSFMAFGGSGDADATNATNRARWKRREMAQTYYETPSMGGFQGLFAFTPGDAAAETADSTVNAKPRVLSLAGTYSNGPIAVGLGYEKHNEFNTVAGSGDDRAWGLSAAYTFAGKVKVGATYLDASYDTAPGRSLDKKTYTLGVDWSIAGPHGLEAQYVHAADSKGNSLIGIQTTSRQGLAAPGADTGGKQYVIGYRYSFSKRTTARLIYNHIDNDNKSFYALGTSGPNVGQNQSAYGMLLSHTF